MEQGLPSFSLIIVRVTKGSPIIFNLFSFHFSLFLFFNLTSALYSMGEPLNQVNLICYGQNSPTEAVYSPLYEILSYPMTNNKC